MSYNTKDFEEGGIHYDKSVKDLNLILKDLSGESPMDEEIYESIKKRIKDIKIKQNEERKEKFEKECEKEREKEREKEPKNLIEDLGKQLDEKNKWHKNMSILEDYVDNSMKLQQQLEVCLINFIENNISVDEKKEIEDTIKGHEKSFKNLNLSKFTELLKSERPDLLKDELKRRAFDMFDSLQMSIVYRNKESLANINLADVYFEGFESLPETIDIYEQKFPKGFEKIVKQTILDNPEYFEKIIDRIDEFDPDKSEDESDEKEGEKEGEEDP